MAFGELVGDEKAHVVAGALVGAARIAEAYDDRGLQGVPGRLSGAPVGAFALFLLALSPIPLFALALEEARELKAGDFVLRGLLPPAQEPPAASPHF